MVVLFMTNPYHVVWNRQSSGERGAWDPTVTIELNNTDSHGDDSNDGHGDGHDGDETTTTALNKTIIKW